jgi:oxygen-independent coproporphyrinogen-3 oxidase
MNCLYIHVPFCLKKCGYCDFYSIEYDKDLVERYLNAIEREMQFYSERLHTLQTVYIGGGTPSVLGNEGLERILNTIIKNSGLADRYEFTIEANPVTLTDRKIYIMKESLINRISIGVQSFDDEILRALGRSHNARDAEDALRLASRKFDNVSIDLIYAIPGQDMPVWEDTLTRALSYDPAHISAYELTPEKGTPLMSDIDAGKVTLPDEENVLHMYEKTTGMLSNRGYIHYEISNYALRGFESLHNLNYWKRAEYVGLGPSAHSFLDGTRYKNPGRIVDYCERLESGIAPFEDVVRLSPVDVVKETIFLGLRIAEGIDLANTIEKAKHAVDHEIKYDKVMAALRPFEDKELIRIRNDRLSITEKGFALSSMIMVEVMRTFGL